MGWPHVAGGAIAVRQAKTGTELAIPIHPALMTELEVAPREGLLFILTRPVKA